MTKVAMNAAWSDLLHPSQTLTRQCKALLEWRLSWCLSTTVTEAVAWPFVVRLRLWTLELWRSSRQQFDCLLVLSGLSSNSAFIDLQRFLFHWIWSPSLCRIGVSEWFHNKTLFYFYSLQYWLVLVKALCYKPEGREFQTRWGGWIFSIYLILPVALGPGGFSTFNRNEYQKQKNYICVE
jgi:hypothetical protein